MKVPAWIGRLTQQLPGWHVWYASSGGLSGRGWYAVPAPADSSHVRALGLPGRVGPVSSPQELRATCRQRYGWDDTCESCGVLARACGHRTPENPQPQRW